MTTTILRNDTVTRTDADLLRDLMREVLDMVAEKDSDGFDGWTPAGRAVLSLASLARRAAGALGGEPGSTLSCGPGVLVVREFAAAVRVLDRAEGSADLDGLLATAKGLHARLHEAVA